MQYMYLRATLAAAAITIVACEVAGGLTHVTDEEYSSWPALYLRDDEAACRSRGATLCAVTFRLRPLAPNHTMFSRMKEYSLRVSSFDHSLLHRRYCVPAHCAGPRLARCVSARLRRVGLGARLHSGPQCGRRGSRRARGWLAAGTVLVVLANVAGTVYDVRRRPERTPNEWLLSWSVVHNWRRLTAPAQDARLAVLAPLDTLRVLMSMCLVSSHHLLMSFSGHVEHPRVYEQVDEKTVLLATNATLMVELYVVMSSLVLAYSLIPRLEKLTTVRRRLTVLPSVMLNRLFRICPTYWCVLAASRWGGGEGGCASLDVYNVLLVHTARGPQSACLLPSWFLATDFQLQVAMSCLLAVCGSGRAWSRAAWLVAVSVVASVFCLSYFGGVHEIAFHINYEVLRSAFAKSESFWWIYASCWGNACAALCGVGLARLLRRTGGRPPDTHKWTVWAAAVGVGPLCAVWVWLGTKTARRPPGVVALYSALARPGGGAIAALLLYVVLHTHDGVRGRCGGRWSRVMLAVSRSSLALSLVHWPLGRLLPNAVCVCACAVWWCVSVCVSVCVTVSIQLPALTSLRRLYAATLHQ